MVLRRELRNRLPYGVPDGCLFSKVSFIEERALEFSAGDVILEELVPNEDANGNTEDAALLPNEDDGTASQSAGVFGARRISEVQEDVVQPDFGRLPDQSFLNAPFLLQEERRRSPDAHRSES